jgi:hypothetical protein
MTTTARWWRLEMTVDGPHCLLPLLLVTFAGCKSGHQLTNEHEAFVAELCECRNLVCADAIAERRANWAVENGLRKVESDPYQALRLKLMPGGLPDADLLLNVDDLRTKGMTLDQIDDGIRRMTHCRLVLQDAVRSPTAKPMVTAPAAVK